MKETRKDSAVPQQRRQWQRSSYGETASRRGASGCLLLKWSGTVGSAVAGSWPGCEEEGLSRAFTSPFSLSPPQPGTVTCTLCT